MPFGTIPATYTGDESTYEVLAFARFTTPARKVQIVRVIDGPGSIPVGAIVTVPTRRVVTI